jgi:hypothetical protein
MADDQILIGYHGFIKRKKRADGGENIWDRSLRQSMVSHRIEDLRSIAVAELTSCLEDEAKRRPNAALFSRTNETRGRGIIGKLAILSHLRLMLWWKVEKKNYALSLGTEGVISIAWSGVEFSLSLAAWNIIMEVQKHWDTVVPNGDIW